MNLTKHVNLWVRSVWIISTGHYLHARSVCLALVYPAWLLQLLPHVWQQLQKQLQVQCGTHRLVPTASNFHKQMSDNHASLSSPLSSCTHTSPHASHLASRSHYSLQNVTHRVFMWSWVLHLQIVHMFTTHIHIFVLHSGYGCREWPGDCADDWNGGACHGQLCPEPGGVSEGPNLFSDSGTSVVHVCQGSVMMAEISAAEL